MADATILVPTHDHAAFLPISIRSALAQRGAEVEVFVVGDGVGDDTRDALAQFAGEPRVRFFDLPKGERLGERNRHVALQESSAPLVCYLSDDDILLPGHVVEMQRCLEYADFAHAVPVLVEPDGVLQYRPADLARPEFLALIRAGVNNFISLTGAAHTRELYERLPHGWRPAPRGKPTDIHMWQQVMAVPGVSGATGTRLTALHFPDPAWRARSDQERADVIDGWLQRAQAPGGDEVLQALLDAAVLRAAQDFKLRTIDLGRRLEAAERELELLRAPWWRRLGRHALRLKPLRAARERLR